MGDSRKVADPTVIAAKKDLGYLLGVLGIQSQKTSETHATCPLCGSDCMQFGPDKKKLGEWYWHCNKGCGGGDLIDAMTRAGRYTYADAFSKIRKDFSGRISASERDEYSRSRSSSYSGSRNGNSGGINPHGYTTGVVSSLERLAGSGSGLLALPKPPEKPEPVLDIARANEFVDQQHAYLMDNFDLVTKWKRGLSQEVCKKYKIGFIEFGSEKWAPWKNPLTIPAAWVLPVTNSDKELKGVKIHFEERPHPNCPKLLWMPFGTVPAYQQGDKEKGIPEIKPAHAYVTMWPHPDTLTQGISDEFSLDAAYWIQRIPPSLRDEWESIVMVQGQKYAYERSTVVEELDSPALWEIQLAAFGEMKQKIFKSVYPLVNKNGQNKATEDWTEYIFICPGELKALACESAGLMATATTGGEGSLPHPSILSRLAGKKICVFGDEDGMKRSINKKDGSVIKIFSTGKEWVEKWTRALEDYGCSSIVCKYGGRTENE